nr:MAG TPA: tail tape measure protein [Caudoviricetes sp.]
MIVINLFNLSARLTLDDESFSRGIQNATQQGEQAGQSVEGIGSRFKNLAKTIAGLAIVKKVADITTSIVKLGIDGNASLETSITSWTTLLGTQEQAKQMMDDITNYAASTPFSKVGVDEMAKQLSNAGFAGEDLFNQLTKFGNMGSAFGIQEDSLKEMVRQYSQVQMAQVAYTEDLNILQDRGIPIYKGLAEVMGVTVAEVKKMAGEGKITADIYNEAINSIASNTEGAMEAQSKTFSGLMSTLQDVTSNIVTKIVEPLFNKVNELLNIAMPILDSFNSKLNEGQSFWTALKETVDEFLPSLNPVMEIMENLGEAITTGLGWIMDNGEALIGIVISLGTAMLVLNVANMIQGMVEAYKAWKIATEGMTIAQWLMNTALLANPIGLVVAAIAGLIVWLVYLWNTNDGFRDAVTSAWNKILEVGKNVWNWISNFFTVSIPNAINTAINFFSQLPTKIGTFLSNSITKMSQFVRDLGSKGLEAAKNLISNITSGLSGLPSKMFEIGKNIIQGMINGVKNMASKVVDSVKGVVNNAISGAKKLLGIHSPSRVFMEIGEYTSEGMAIGIEQNEDMVQKASENMVNTAIPDEIKVAETLNINRSAETSLINSLLSKLNNDKEIVLNIDGREFARATAEHMNNALNDYTNRYSFA